MNRFGKLEIIGKGLGRNRRWNPFQHKEVPVDKRRFHHPIQEIILGEVLQNEAALTALNRLPELIEPKITEIGVELDSIRNSLTQGMKSQLNDYAAGWVNVNRRKDLPYFNRHELNFDAVGVGIGIASVVARTVYRELEAGLNDSGNTQEVMFEYFVTAFHQSFQRNIVRPGLTMLSAKAIRADELTTAIYTEDPQVVQMQARYIKSCHPNDIGHALFNKVNDIIAHADPTDSDYSQYQKVRDTITEIGIDNVGSTTIEFVHIIYGEEGLVNDLSQISPNELALLQDSIGHESGIELLQQLPSIGHLYKLLTDRYVQVNVLGLKLMSTCPRTGARMIDKEKFFSVSTRYGQTIGDQLNAYKTATQSGGLDQIYGCPAFHVKTTQGSELPDLLAGLLPSDRSSHTFIDYTNALLLKALGENWHLIQQHGLL